MGPSVVGLAEAGVVEEGEEVGLVGGLSFGFLEGEVRWVGLLRGELVGEVDGSDGAGAGEPAGYASHAGVFLSDEPEEILVVEVGCRFSPRGWVVFLLAINDRRYFLCSRQNNPLYSRCRVPTTMEDER